MNYYAKVFQRGSRWRWEAYIDDERATKTCVDPGIGVYTALIGGGAWTQKGAERKARRWLDKKAAYIKQSQLKDQQKQKAIIIRPREESANVTS